MRPVQNFGNNFKEIFTTLCIKNFRVFFLFEKIVIEDFL